MGKESQCLPDRHLPDLVKVLAHIGKEQGILLESTAVAGVALAFAPIVRQSHTILDLVNILLEHGEVVVDAVERSFAPASAFMSVPEQVTLLLR